MVKRQYDTSDSRKPGVQAQLTMEHTMLAGCLTKLKRLALKVQEFAKTRLPGAPAAQTGGEQFKAPPAPMSTAEPARKPSNKRPSRDQPPPAPTEDKKFPFNSQGGGIPQYAPNAVSYNGNLTLPAKKRKVGDPGTPVPSPPTHSPKPKDKSPRAAPVEKQFRCKQTGCQNSKTTFATKEELQKHLDTAHEEQPPADPLQFCLLNMRIAWNLDDQGKIKTGSTKMEKAASKQSPTSQAKALGPGGVSMSRTATGANSNAPRTPQSMSTAGGNSKPATPAMQAGKLPIKQTQAPPTPPQDLWASCSISAHDIAGVLPAPVPSDSLASLTPDSKTSPEGVEKPAEKGAASPKTPKASDAMQLDSIQVKDISTVNSKVDGMEFDFDFGGGLGPIENGMFASAETLSGGGYGGSLEELFGGDIPFDGTSSWEDMMYLETKTQNPAGREMKKATGTKTPTAGKPKKQAEDDNWAKAFEMAWD